MNPDARGVSTGISRGTTSAHIARATLEAIACQSADVLRVMECDTGTAVKELHVDGGTSQSDLLMQMQADLLGIPVRRPAGIETTALGAAMLAGSFSNARRINQVFEPPIGETERRQIQSRWANAVGKARQLYCPFILR